MAIFVFFILQHEMLDFTHVFIIYSISSNNSPRRLLFLLFKGRQLFCIFSSGGGGGGNYLRGGINWGMAIIQGHTVCYRENIPFYVL